MRNALAGALLALVGAGATHGEGTGNTTGGVDEVHALAEVVGRHDRVTRNALARGSTQRRRVEEALEALRERAMDGDDPEVRAAALEALVETGDERALGQIGRALRTGTVGEKAAARSLGRALGRAIREQRGQKAG